MQQSIDAFRSHPQIDGVMVVISPEHEQYFDLDVPHCHGGKERQDSVRLGLVELIKYAPKNVLIHDAARPYVSHAVIDNVLKALDVHETAIPVIDEKDSVRLDGVAIDRSKLKIIQTPQGFDYKKILHAHQHNSTHWVKLTDDAQVAEVAGMNLFFVEGDEMNIKITNPSDIKNTTPDVRTGQGFDVHEFEVGDAVILCGVRIPHTKKLKGHSDADVALHALTDAMLGAVGDGDIGQHFPPQDNRWKDENSANFVDYALNIITGKGGRINNVDITIICEEPKITPHKQTMKDALARMLNLDSSRINVKATTTEGLGFTGRREGIAAQVVVTVLIN